MAKAKRIVPTVFLVTALLDLMYSPVEHAGQRLDCHQAVVRVEHAVPLLGQGVARNSCSPRRALADAAPCGGAWTNMIFIRGSEGANEMCTEETCTEEMCTDETMGTLPRDTPIPPTAFSAAPRCAGRRKQLVGARRRPRVALGAGRRDQRCLVLGRCAVRSPRR